MHCKIVLRCISGNDAKKKWFFSFAGMETVVLGRLRGCHLLLRDPRVSESHCLIQIQNGLLCIVDMGSTYGTRVSGVLAQGAIPLTHGDKIDIGDTTLQLEILSSSLVPVSSQPVENSGQYASEEKPIAIESEPEPDFSAPEPTNRKRLLKTPPASLRIYPSPQQRRRGCLFCDLESDELYFSAPPLRWLHCPRCKGLANFVSLAIASTHKIFGEPVHIAWHGILVLVQKDNNRQFLYISRLKGQQFSPVFIDHLKKVSRSRHPNILPIVGVKNRKGRLCVYFRYFPGDFLPVFGKFSVRSLLATAKKVAKALEYTEEQWGSCGELVPSSIYIRADGTPFLYGFGLPRRQYLSANPPGWQNFRYHYLQYAPPEAITNPCQKSHDVFSLAAILFFALHRRPIYDAKNFSELYQESTSYEPPAFDSSLKPLLQNSLRKALARDPGQRFATMNDLHDVLCMLEALYKPSLAN